MNRSFQGGVLVPVLETASSPSIALDLSSARAFELNLTSNTTISFINVPAQLLFGGLNSSLRFTVKIKQDGTGGRTVNWPPSVEFITGSSLNTEPNATTVFELMSFDFVSWVGKSWSSVDSEVVQDLVAAMLQNSNSVEWSYNDTSNQVSASVRLDATRGLSINSSGLGVADGGLRPSYLSSTNAAVNGYLLSVDTTTNQITYVPNSAGYTDAQAVSAVVAATQQTNTISWGVGPLVTANVRLNGSTLESTSTGLRINALGVGTTQLANNSVTHDKLSVQGTNTQVLSTNGTDLVWIARPVSYVANTAIADVAGSLLDTNSIDFSYNGTTFNISADVRVDTAIMEIVAGGVRVKDGGLPAAKLKATNTPTNGQLPSFDAVTGDFTWITVTGGGGTVDEQFVRDTMGTAFVDTNSIDITYSTGTTFTADLRLDGSTLSVSGAGVKVTDDGIGTTQLANTSVTMSKLSASGTNTQLLSTDGANLTWVNRSDVYNPVQALSDLQAYFLDTNSIDFTYNAGAPSLTASVRLEGTSLEIVTGGLRVRDGGLFAVKLAATNTPTNGQLPSFDSATGRVTWIDPDSDPVLDQDIRDVIGAALTDSNSIDFTYNGTTVLSGNVRLNGTSLEIASPGLRVRNGGITPDMLLVSGTKRVGDYPFFNGSGWAWGNLHIDAFVAFHALAAGDLVALVDDAGTIKVRKADKAGFPAFGYVTSSYSAGANAAVYRAGTVTKSGLTTNERYYLDSNGGISLAPTYVSGEYAQYVGVALSTTQLLFLYNDVIEIEGDPDSGGPAPVAPHEHDTAHITSGVFIPARLASGTPAEGNVPTVVAGSMVFGSPRRPVLGAGFDGAFDEVGEQQPVEVGMYEDVPIVVDMTVTGWTVLMLDSSDGVITNSGSVEFGVFVKPLTSGSFTSITASAPPQASTGNNNSGSPTGWTTTLTAGNILRFQVSSVTGSVPRCRVFVRGI